MSIRWNFPYNSGGQIHGVADAGIETFHGNEIMSLAREICQNSLDAHDNSGKPVEVHFNLHNIKNSDIPGIEEYIGSLNKSAIYWKEKSRPMKFINTALEMLNNKYSYVLRISDYNTVGLEKPYDPASQDGWNALTKIDGGATKEKGKDGAFGIGKNAPFSNSAFRMVFYRTLVSGNQRAAQGMVRAISFPNNGNDILGSMTTGFGYYGDPTGNMPVEAIQQLEQLKLRDRIGTDIFIYGFIRPGKTSTSLENKWKKDIAKEVLNNYIVSIMKGKLDVRIANFPYNKQNISKIMDEATKTMADAKSCYKLMTASKDKVKEFTCDIDGLGIFKLRVLIDLDDDTLNKKVLVCKPSGMKLHFLKSAPSMDGYTGLLEMEGDKLVEYFSEMENPAHTAWSANRHNNPEKAQEYIQKVENWVKQSVLSLYGSEGTEEMEAVGLSDNLKMNEDELSGKNETDSEYGFDDKIDNIEISFAAPTKAYSGYYVSAGSHDLGKTTQSNSRKTRRIPGEVTKKGELSAIRTLRGTRKRSKREKHKGIVDSAGKDIVNEPLKETRNSSNNIPLKALRLFKKNDSMRLSFIISNHIMSGYIEIIATGENGRNAHLNILSAQAVSGCKNVTVNNGKILFEDMYADCKISIDMKMATKKSYGMGVIVYENR